MRNGHSAIARSAVVERAGLAHRLRVDLAHDRLAEVGDVGAAEPAAEPLRARHADLRAAQLEHAVLALEHVDAALRERGGHLVAAVGVPVVVAEHGQHGHAVQRRPRRGPPWPPAPARRAW